MPLAQQTAPASLWNSGVEQKTEFQTRSFLAGLMQVQFVAGMRREAAPLSDWFAAAATHAMLFEEKCHGEFS